MPGGPDATVSPGSTVAAQTQSGAGISAVGKASGAGVSVINGTIVKVRKGAGTYDEEELAARAAFQHAFLTALRRHPALGGIALYPFLVST